jgi:predicted NAD/FAD-binding protein
VSGRWKNFKDGKKMVVNEGRIRRASSAVTHVKTDKAEKLLNEESLNVSLERVHRIVRAELDMSRVV